MGAFIETIRRSGSGCYDVKVIKPNYSRKYPYLRTSETVWVYRCECMPLIDDYRSDELKRSDRAEKHLIRLAKWRGDKTIVRY